RLLGREVEVFGIRIGDAGLVARQSGEPDEEPLQGGQSGVQRRLAQWLTAAVAPLVGEIALKALGLLDMERLEVLVPGIDLEPGNRLRQRIDALLAMTLSLGKIGEVLALHTLVCGVVVGHRLSPSVESQFTLGFDVSSMRGRACVTVISRSPRTASSFFGLTRR